MLKEAIEKIETMAQPQVFTRDNKHYVIDKDGGYTEILPDIPMVDEIVLTSLDALVKMIRTEALKFQQPLYVTIPSHMRVQCFSSPEAGFRYCRTMYYRVSATDVPGWESSVQMGFEEAIIAMRTRFQPSTDSEYVLQLLNNISTGSKVTFNDNGVATTVVTSQGVSLATSTNIRPIVNLRPYRTFQEVDQPESPFLIRVSERAIRFIEADGGMWKLKARQTVKEFLEAALADEVAEGTVVIAL